MKSPLKRGNSSLANHGGTESCAVIREGLGEASTGEHMGQPLNRESLSFRVPTRCPSRKAIRTGALLQAPGRPGAVGEPGTCGRSLYGNREILGLAGDAPPVRAGKARSHSR